MRSLEERLFAELDDHLNSGCIDSACKYSPGGEPEFDAEFLHHLVAVLMDVYSEEE